MTRHRPRFETRAAQLLAVGVVVALSATVLVACARADEEQAGEPAGGAGYDCIEPTPGYRTQADELVAGVFRLGSADPVNLGLDVDWSADPYASSTWRFNLHNLKYIYSLLERSEEVPDAQAYLSAARSILRDWVRDNPVDDPPSDFSWNDHTTALRTQVLACASNVFDGRWVTEALKQHADVLAEEDFYAGNWNHGLDQNIGLLAAGCVLDDRASIRLAEERTRRLLTEAVDEEGVTNEQSVGYQYYNWWLIGHLEDTLDACGLPHPDTMRRRDAMPRFLAHATMPDGSYVPLGDTANQPATSIPGTVAEYAATRGSEGPVPDSPVAVYERGFVFGRSGWGTDRPFDEESFYAIRFGPGREIHGHRDHMSIVWYALGRSLLTEGGFGGYGQGAYRDWQRSEHAHNVVVVDGAGRFLWDAETRLTDHTVESTHQSFDLFDRPYRGVDRRRSVLVSHEPAVIVVRDNLTGGPYTFRQLWHLPSDLAVRIAEGGATASDADGDVALHIRQLGPADLSVVSGQTDPWQGWVSNGPDHRAPAPTVISTVQGRNATFLTVIAAGSTVDVVEVGGHRRVTVDGEHFDFSVTDGDLQAVASRAP